MDFFAPIQEEEVVKWIQEGTEIHGYRFENLIGYGGFAQVYRVTSLKYNIEFAIKVMPFQGCSNSVWESFINEIKMLMKLDHPNIIRLYDHFREEKYFYIVLEYCPNGSLQDLIFSSEKMNSENVLRYLKEILNGLAYMHQRNICHHDIKPSNILLDPYGHVKITDFGTSLIKAETSNKQGSFAYCAPEMLLKTRYDPASADIWALGVTICQLITKQFPIDINSLKEGRVVNVLAYLEMPSFFRMFLSEILVNDPLERAKADQLEILCSKMMESSKSMSDQVKTKKKTIGFFSSPSTEKLGSKMPRNNSTRNLTSKDKAARGKTYLNAPMVNMPKTFWM